MTEATAILQRVEALAKELADESATLAHKVKTGVLAPELALLHACDMLEHFATKLNEVTENLPTP